VWPLLAQHDHGPGGLQETIDKLARTPLSQIVIFVGICTIVRVALYGYLRSTVPHRRHGVYRVAKFFNEAMDAIVYAGVFVFMLIRPFAVQAFLIPSGSMLQTLYVNDFIVANKAIYRYTEPKIGDIVVFKPPERALQSNQKDVDFIKRCVGLPGDLVQVIDGKLWRNGKPIDEPYLSRSPNVIPGDDASANGHPTESGSDVKMDLDWKLVHYEGTAQPKLKGQYIPVQIRRGDVGEGPRVNYGHTAICQEFGVGVSPDSSKDYSWATDWTPADSLSAKDWEFAHELENAPPARIPKGFVLMMGDNRNNSYDGRAWGLVPREDVIGRSEFIWLPIGRWRITR
jgi:signal peptidase I